ncbi:helix-turn-helix protein [Mucilaginibacter oryzae]|uniref:Helix-turn-helix protein n=1 Tax=Mucilaginibacter oryzae TaxID=468058 RepID=A0A316H843_9SPHI|nr:helix-turn-helix transcriptional regulator [Mucilaginibacter oryzae]PWK72898.1 helix-turn-helix protein [Mucilaginibacter oryzae]
MKKHYKNTVLAEKVGSKIEEIRIAKGVTQERLEELTGLDLRQIGRILRGESNPTISTLEIFATILDSEIVDFFNFKLSESEKFNLTKFKEAQKAQEKK